MKTEFSRIMELEARASFCPLGYRITETSHNTGARGE